MPQQQPHVCFSSNHNNRGPPFRRGGGGPSASSSSSKPSSGGRSSFQPRRRPPKEYRPFVSKRVKTKKETEGGHPFFRFSTDDNPAVTDDLERQFGPHMAEVIKKMRREKAIYESDTMGLHDKVEEDLRALDFFGAEAGTTEEQIFMRRAMEHRSEEEQKKFHRDLREWEVFGEQNWLNFEDHTDYRRMKPPRPKKNEEFQHLMSSHEENILFSRQDDDPDNRFDPYAKAHGVWSEYLVSVDRGNHNWRGGRLISFRAMVVGGNGNGCAGFGVGKGNTALKAMINAGHESRRNIFYVEPYLNNRFTSDLVGRHNSCKVVLRTTRNGLRGNVLCREILTRFGIVHASCKAHGNRHPWSVVYATFKAVLGHECLEDMAMKTGRRLTTLDKMLRMRL